MNLKELYVEMSTNDLIYKKYCSTGKNNYGKIFAFISTNYRTILSKKGKNLLGFAQGFRVLDKVCGIKRSNWLRHFGTKQEIEKQHTVNMKKSEFFSVSNDTYNKTSRGKVFEKMIKDSNLTYEEKNLLCYLLICTGYFNDIPNYLFERTKEIFDFFYDAGYETIEVLDLIKDFVKKGTKNGTPEFYIKHEYFILDAFYHDYDGINFLKNYKNSDITEKNRLHDYIYSNYKSANYKNENNKCILSYKFKPGGACLFSTIICNAWMLFVTKKIQETKINSFDSFIINLINIYKELFEISEKNTKTFVYDTNKNRSVFQVIYCKIYNIPLPIFEMEKDLTLAEIKEYGKLDNTDEEGSAVINQISQSLKKIAKIKADYKCEMDECEICKYFTAKENHKTYLEIHHFIPKEFANDFEVSIENIHNYVALCPNCHRKIHLAEDNERKHLINIIYQKRINDLKKEGLDVDINTIYSYYKIEKTINLREVENNVGAIKIYNN